MKRLWIVPALLLGVFLFASCSQKAPARKVSGAWQLQSGELGLGFLGVGELEYLDFDPSGPFVDTYGREAAVELKGCDRSIVEVGESVLVFWPPEHGLRLSHPADLPQSLGFAFQYAVTGDTLTLTDATGKTAVFRKLSRVPADADCAELEPTTVGSVDLGVEMAYSSNLLSDGTLLWVAGNDRTVYPIDPATGSVGAGQTLTNNQYYHAVTVQEGDFWAHCHCGDSSDIRRLRLGTAAPIDSIDTDTDLGRRISIYAGAWDGSRLWLFGLNRDQDRRELLVVDSDSEPDGLDAVHVFDTGALRDLTFHDGALWGLFRFAGWQVAQLDPANGRVTRSYALPDPGPGNDYLGLASLGSELYLLLETEGGHALQRMHP